eukprot:c20194_g2_i2 orf=59-553(+)
MCLHIFPQANLQRAKGRNSRASIRKRRVLLQTGESTREFGSFAAARGALRVSPGDTFSCFSGHYGVFGLAEGRPKTQNGGERSKARPAGAICRKEKAKSIMGGGEKSKPRTAVAMGRKKQKSEPSILFGGKIADGETSSTVLGASLKFYTHTDTKSRSLHREEE